MPLDNLMHYFSSTTWETFFKIAPAIVGIASGLLSPQVRNFLMRILQWIWKYIKPLGTPFMIPGMIIQQNQKILDELMPNSGGSLRDAVNRLDRRQILLYDRILGILDRDETPIFETDDQGQYIWVNNAFLNMCGRPVTEITGHGWINAVLEEDRNRVIAEWDRAIEEKRVFELTFRYHHIYTEEVFKAAVRATPTKSFGEVVGWTGYITLI